MNPPITLYQRHRLLDEVTQRPGQSTQQLAALISVDHRVAYRALRRHALAGLVYSISIGGMGVMQQACRWWPCGVEATLEDISARFAPPEAQEEARQCAKRYHRSRSLLPPLLETAQRTAGNNAAPGGVPCLIPPAVTA
ncbi:MAG: hypothetical protein ABTR07_05425 [Candidatus Competibacter denitrificans]